jgi:GT2 family glycosyltransferase
MVSVIIPTLFPGPKLENYATSLSRYSTVREVTIVVNTTGADRDENTVHWRFLGKNKGFTGACNAGAKIAKGEFLLFLNDDCDVSEDALRKMVGLLEQDVVVATQPIVKKQILNSKSETLSDEEKGSLHPRSSRNRDDIAQSKDIENIGFWVDTRIGKAYPVTVNSSSKQEYLDTRKGPLHPRNARSRDDTKPESLNACPSIDCRLTTDDYLYGLSGTCLLIRKHVFEKVGMWDGSFHSYLEDVDLAIRLYKAGYKVAPCLDTEVTHEHMATSSKMGLYKEKQDVKNWWRLIIKHPHVFVRPGTIFPLLLERGRNMSGLIKKFLNRVIQ